MHAEKISFFVVRYLDTQGAMVAYALLNPDIVRSVQRGGSSHAQTVFAGSRTHPVPPEVLLAMARPMIHHRAPEFDKLFAEVREGPQVAVPNPERCVDSRGVRHRRHGRVGFKFLVPW